MTMAMKKKTLAVMVAALCVPVVTAGVQAQEQATSQKATSQTATDAAATDKYLERIQIIGHGDALRSEGGSATLIDEAELERFEYDDINRILANVPGVNIRQEDGYGLRPNIGFRGATPERSKKIALMEDGILIAPAPYSASAAYYFPMVSRMTAVEVFKGPASIKYGPNTVSGALNMTSRMVPEGAEGQLDISAGSDGYTKAHGFYGDTRDELGFLIEGINARADGFKDLDGGGDTGFRQNNYLAKVRYTPSQSKYNQFVEMKLGYGNEVSHETYLGLTDEDFSKSPNRRYAASQQGLMDWTHKQVQLTHHIDFDVVDVTTRVYRNDFERSWVKLNGFQKTGSTQTDRSLQEILADPHNGVNAIYYQILTGNNDSEKHYEQLIIGDNAREYYSQGIQSDVAMNSTWGGIDHKLEVGLRYHRDQIIRKHTEDLFVMTDGYLEHTGAATKATSHNRETTDALSVYVSDTLTFDRLTVTAGIRGEFIDAEYQNNAPDMADDWLEKDSRIWLPGVSAFYQYSDSLGLLFGVNEGYVPTSPQQAPAIQHESSVNYELGARFNNGNVRAEVIGFFNDFSNLKESCTFSASSSCTEKIDQEYNGGEVDIYGIESTFAYTQGLTNVIDMPMSLVYTYTASEFKTDIVSDFPLWGNINAGDELPYLPKHQLTATIGLAANNWQVSLLAKYVGEMKETSGTGVSYEGVTTEALTVVDLSASYDLDDYGSVYFKADNLFDKVAIVSHRPYGARPSKPQQFFAGYKYSF